MPVKKKPPPGIAPLKEAKADEEVKIKSASHVEVKRAGSSGKVYSVTSEGVGKYRFEDLKRIDGERLGEGAQGRVNLYRHEPTGEMLALKVSPLSSSMSRSGLESELGHVLGMETHPNIVASHDVYFRDAHLMILMEYCSNGSLTGLLDHLRPLGTHIPMATLAYMTAQVVKGLHHLHSKNVLHRDMKPSNILINKDGVVKICDFGVSKVLNGEKITHTAVGASAYLSPERVRGEGYFMPSDVWALGVTIAELALGDYPWKQKRMDVIALSDMLANGRAVIEWPSTGNYSEELKDFVARCLNSNPQERATIEQLLAHPFVSKSEDNRESMLKWLAVVQAGPGSSSSSSGATDWRKMKDSKGRVFYFNKATGVKTWDHPTKKSG
eukprot:TRINITY_DN1335_c0_g1_i1.p1 TRINITY_DN1335_c0_g1~~TRINITY_DN1335_c0_g1_i1.p1  ORF type:complete len:383 (+),score=126.56 TRINITY_DN1335_c0_g1_i1:167-1315(+)